MSGSCPTPAEILRAVGVPFTSLTHPPIRTYEDIKRELCLPPQQLVKTMAFRAEDGSGFVLASLPVLSKLRYGRLAAEVGVPRARLHQAGPEDLAALEMQPGGISPVTRAPDVRVVFDTPIATMGTIYCGSGRADETITLTAHDLIKVVNPTIAPIAAAPDQS
jgi:Cys-tRNA(Pro)/Cys-tRNA(Cys) deacylase